MIDDASHEAAEAEYCREIEAHLCRCNGGHLVRLVGPSFEHVRAWSSRGIPLKVALEGIDRRIERARARGAQRRPIRAEFCEADVLDVFDEWRRALGLPAPSSSGVDVHEDEAPSDPESRKVPLARHIERATARLIALRGRSDVPPLLSAAVTSAVEQLDAAYPTAKGVRGDARVRLMAILARVDDELMAAARDGSGEVVATLRHEADGEVAPYRNRMPAAAFAQAVTAATDRLLRQHFGLPAIRLDG